MPKYYHYTDKDGYDGIMGNPASFLDRLASILPGKDKEPPTLKPSTGESGDAHYGEGFYFTDLVPGTHSREQIARTLWDGSGKRNLPKTDYFIELDLHGNTRVESCREHVFRIPPDTKARPPIGRHGKNPRK